MREKAEYETLSLSTLTSEYSQKGKKNEGQNAAEPNGVLSLSLMVLGFHLGDSCQPFIFIIFIIVHYLHSYKPSEESGP